MIGQNDPFSEFGRQPATRAPAASTCLATAIAAGAATGRTGGRRASGGQPFYGAPGFAATQPFGNDLYQVDPATPVYGEPLNGASGYAQEPAEFEPVPPFHAGARRSVQYVIFRATMPRTMNSTMTFRRTAAASA